MLLSVITRIMNPRATDLRNNIRVVHFLSERHIRRTLPLRSQKKNSLHVEIKKIKTLSKGEQYKKNFLSRVFFSSNDNF